MASSVYLFARSNNYKTVPNWWTLSFTDPKSNDLNFVIENFGDNANFHWELLQDRNKLFESDVQIKTGEKRELSPRDSETNSLENNKYTIWVSSNGETKEVYKNIRN